ncbi:hypothetical protein CTAYLR_003089 [Chrysophaeum taylorii]|uniref:LamG-like jellyroll fold domain-containing protein n=1 Tax=Chrysophaeum taylorii TaxID=2483200 RepID=A0AAD7U6H9_9STRA|nr:hypothetical protein CTAYLR_003089 [Chrysophaeum taylorii]
MTALLVLAALSQRAAAVVPLAHYTFDGQSLASSAGESNTGTNYGATYVTGMDGGDALYFDGGSDFVEFPAAITVTAGENRSVCVWARVHGDYFDGGVLYFSGSLETLGCNEFSLQLKEYAASYWTMLLSRYGTCDKVIQVSGSDDDEWHHYCTTYDGVDWHLYFDGALQSEGPASLDTGTTYPLRLGNRPTEDYGNQYHFTGYVDELYVFDVVLRASDVTSIYNLYTATPTEFPTGSERRAKHAAIVRTDSMPDDDDAKRAALCRAVGFADDDAVQPPDIRADGETHVGKHVGADARAFVGPDFAADGTTHLPYCRPDCLAIGDAVASTDLGSVAYPIDVALK